MKECWNLGHCLTDTSSGKKECPKGNNVLFFFFATMHNLWDLSSLTKEGIHSPCIGSTVTTTGPLGKSVNDVLLKRGVWNWAARNKKWPWLILTKLPSGYAISSTEAGPAAENTHRLNLLCPSDSKETKPVILRKSNLNIHWKDGCWSWSSNTLVTWCQEPTHWKRLWCWERLKAGGEGGNRGWDGWMASLTQWT